MVFYDILYIQLSHRHSDFINQKICYNIIMDISRLKHPKKLTSQEKKRLAKAVKKTVSQYKITLELLART